MGSVDQDPSRVKSPDNSKTVHCGVHGVPRPFSLWLHRFLLSAVAVVVVALSLVAVVPSLAVLFVAVVPSLAVPSLVAAVVVVLQQTAVVE